MSNKYLEKIANKLVIHSGPQTYDIPSSDYSVKRENIKGMEKHLEAARQKFARGFDKVTNSHGKRMGLIAGTAAGALALGRINRSPNHKEMDKSFRESGKLSPHAEIGSIAGLATGGLLGHAVGSSAVKVLKENFPKAGPNHFNPAKGSVALAGALGGLLLGSNLGHNHGLKKKYPELDKKAELDLVDNKYLEKIAGISFKKASDATGKLADMSRALRKVGPEFGTNPKLYSITGDGGYMVTEAGMRRDPKMLPKVQIKASKVALSKQAELTDENKAVGKAFTESALVGLPAHLAGAALGASLARKFAHGKTFALPSVKIAKTGKTLGGGHITSENVGQFLGTTALGGLADIAALKHSLHGKIEEK